MIKPTPRPTNGQIISYDASNVMIERKKHQKQLFYKNLLKKLGFK